MTTPNPAQQVVASRMHEDELLRSVVSLAQFHGWLSYHTWNSRHSASGFPDLVMVRLGRLLFVELKSEHGKLTAPQQAWGAALTQAEGAGAVAYRVWRPGDLISGSVEAALR
ncbi:MAG: VRR-NUC domain-containing protein [Candidatus Dormibacteria bacterium]